GRLFAYGDEAYFPDDVLSRGGEDVVHERFHRLFGVRHVIVVERPDDGVAAVFGVGHRRGGEALAAVVGYVDGLHVVVEVGEPHVSDAALGLTDALDDGPRGRHAHDAVHVVAVTQDALLEELV